MKNKIIGIFVMSLLIAAAVLPVAGTIESCKIKSVNNMSDVIIQPPEQWNKTFGGIDSDIGYSVQQTSDGGYIITGFLCAGALADLYLIKTDSSGNQQWSKTLGGAIPDEGWSVQEISGGYIITGETYSYGTGNSGDIWLVKTDSNGNEQWNKTFGGNKDEYGYSVLKVSGGYIIAGKTFSYGAGGSDVYLIKTDSSGNQQWSQTYGGTGDDVAYSVSGTSDGGYILLGWTDSYGAGYYDFWLIKTDSNGNKIWDKTFGGFSWEQGTSVQQTTDGGYILLGWTGSYGAGYYDFWLIKTDSNGNKIWDKTFGGGSYEYAWAVQQTTDGGYALAGSTGSFGAGNPDAWLIKTDSSGNQQWSQTYGGTGDDFGYSMQQTSDGGYIIAGCTESYGAGGFDVWLIKVGLTTNQPPNKPTTPSGPITGTAGTSYPYQTSAVDPEGDKVEYGWDWNGDGVVDQWDNNGGSYYTSGVTITTSHSWPIQGTYSIKVVAKDINGAQGPWSNPLTVTMPRNKAITNLFLLKFFKQFPILTLLL